MELFDFATYVGGYIEYNGSYSPDNTYINTYLKIPCLYQNGQSIFGRSETPDLEEALTDLANKLTTARQVKYGPHNYTVPPLVHTPNYRG